MFPPLLSLSEEIKLNKDLNSKLADCRARHYRKIRKAEIIDRLLGSLFLFLLGVLIGIIAANSL